MFKSTCIPNNTASIFLRPNLYRKNVPMKGREKGQIRRNQMTNPPPKGNNLEQHDSSLTFFVMYRAVGDNELRSQQFLYTNYIGGSHFSKLVLEMALCSGNLLTSLL